VSVIRTGFNRRCGLSYEWAGRLAPDR